MVAKKLLPQKNPIDTPYISFQGQNLYYQLTTNYKPPSLFDWTLTNFEPSIRRVRLRRPATQWISYYSSFFFFDIGIGNPQEEQLQTIKKTIQQKNTKQAQMLKKHKQNKLKFKQLNKQTLYLKKRQMIQFNKNTSKVSNKHYFKHNKKHTNNVATKNITTKNK